MTGTSQSLKKQAKRRHIGVINPARRKPARRTEVYSKWAICSFFKLHEIRVKCSKPLQVIVDVGGQQKQLFEHQFPEIL